MSSSHCVAELLADEGLGSAAGLQIPEQDERMEHPFEHPGLHGNFGGSQSTSEFLVLIAYRIALGDHDGGAW